MQRKGRDILEFSFAAPLFCSKNTKKKCASCEIGLRSNFAKSDKSQLFGFA
jgi:hypothetical protein